MSTGGKKKQSGKGASPFEPFWTFPHCLFFLLPPSTPFFLLTRFIFLFRCNLPPSSLSFVLSFFSAPLCPSVSLCLVVSEQPDPTPHRQQPGWYPALYSPVHCNPATVSSRFVVDGWDHPLVSEWYLPDGGREGGGSHCWRFPYEGGSYHICAWEIWGQLESLRFQSLTWMACVMCALVFFFLVQKYCIELGM